MLTSQPVALSEGQQFTERQNNPGEGGATPCSVLLLPVIIIWTNDESRRDAAGSAVSKIHLDKPETLTLFLHVRITDEDPFEPLFWTEYDMRSLSFVVNNTTCN